MKIGIIIYSHTGNTLSVGERLKEILAGKGYTVYLEHVTTVDGDSDPKNSVKLDKIPDIGDYDHVIIGAPVQAFSLSPVMKAYLSQLTETNGKNFACFVTQHLKKPWMGGNQAVKQMIRLISRKGGKVTDTGIVNWSGQTREEQIAGIMAKLGTI